MTLLLWPAHSVYAICQVAVQVRSHLPEPSIQITKVAGLLDTKEMLEHFTEEEMERMSAFTETPSYEREPEQLLPEDDDETADSSSHVGPSAARRRR